MKREKNLREYLDFVLRRKWIIGISAIVIPISVFIYSKTRPLFYESRLVFMIENTEIGFTNMGMMLTEQARPIEYYEAIMASRNTMAMIPAAWLTLLIPVTAARAVFPVHMQC